MKKLNLLLFVFVSIVAGALVLLTKPAPVLAQGPVPKPLSWGTAPTIKLAPEVSGCQMEYEVSGTITNHDPWRGRVEWEIERGEWVASVVIPHLEVGGNETVSFILSVRMKEDWRVCGEIRLFKVRARVVTLQCENATPWGNWQEVWIKGKKVEPCKASVDIITWGGWAGIRNTVSVDGTEQPFQFTGVNPSGDAQTTWFFWLPPRAHWNIEAKVGNPPGKDPNRWQTRFIGIKKGGPFDDKPIIPGEPVTDIGRCERLTFYFQLLDTWALEPPVDPSDPPDPPAPAADPPSEPPINPLDDSPQTHTVQKGECLWSIWEDLGRPGNWGDWLKTVSELNSLDNPDLLSIGQVLVLPG